MDDSFVNRSAGQNPVVHRQILALLQIMYRLNAVPFKSKPTFQARLINIVRMRRIYTYRSLHSW